MNQDTVIANDSDRVHVDLDTVRKRIANYAPGSPVDSDDERYLKFGRIRDRVNQRVRESAA